MLIEDRLKESIPIKISQCSPSGSSPKNSTDVFRGISPSVMVPRLQEIDAVVADQIDDAVLLGQTAGPDAGGKVFQMFRLADAYKRE